MSSPPDPKKPKLDDTESLREGEYDVSSDDECFKGMNREEIKEYRHYAKQLRESDCFDIDFLPTKLPTIIGSHVFPCNLSDPKEYEKTEKCTQFVIERYNELMKGNSWLRLEGIPKATRSAPHYICNFYITFEAEDTVSRRSDTYQTAICQMCIEGSIEVLSIRKKSDKKELCFPVDLDDQEELVRLNKCSAATISEYNEAEEGNLELEFVKVVKALQNVDPDCLYYWITFDAKDTKSNKINTYSAQVFYDPENDNINIVDWPEVVEQE